MRHRTIHKSIIFVAYIRNITHGSRDTEDLTVTVLFISLSVAPPPTIYPQFSLNHPLFLVVLIFLSAGVLRYSYSTRYSPLLPLLNHLHTLSYSISFTLSSTTLLPPPCCLQTVVTVTVDRRRRVVRVDLALVSVPR